MVGRIGSRRVTDRVTIHDELNAAISLPPLRCIIGSYRLGLPEPLEDRPVSPSQGRGVGSPFLDGQGRPALPGYQGDHPGP